MTDRNDMISFAQSMDNHKRCLSCGETLSGRKRRYCSSGCRDTLHFALRWLKNLLLAFNTNYATFSFSDYLLIVNVLPYRSKEVFSFFYARTPGQLPAENLKSLCIELSRTWYHKNKQCNCRSLATVHTLSKGKRGVVSRDLVKPITRISRASVQRQLKTLKLSIDDIKSNGSSEKLKAAYRREALKTHPDVGGDGEKFRIVSEAYQELVEWLKHPRYIKSRGVPGKWSYDGCSYRWRAPL